MEENALRYTLGWMDNKSHFGFGNEIAYDKKRNLIYLAERNKLIAVRPLNEDGTEPQ